MADEHFTIAERLRHEANSAERIMNKLAAKLPPGHADYISKAGAARSLAALVLNLRQIAHDTEH